jgi:hypothetical protein
MRVTELQVFRGDYFRATKISDAEIKVISVSLNNVIKIRESFNFTNSFNLSQDSKNINNYLMVH